MIQFKTIKSKIIVSVLGSFILLLLLFALFQIKEIKDDEYAHLDSITTTINSILVKHIRGYVFEHDKKNLQLSLNSIDSKYIKTISILDQDGMSIVSNTKMKDQKYQKYQKFDALLIKKDHRITNRDEYLILNSFKVLNVPIGYLLLEADLETYHLAVKNKMEILFLFLLLALLVLFILSIFIANNISMPIEKIIKKLRLIKENEILEFEEQSQIEFRFLAHSIATKHNALSKLNQSLKDEVDKKTRTLQFMNDNLQHKIDDEIHKSRKKDQQMIEQSRLAQMGEMISMIAHQWRQPLAAISATTNALILKNKRGGYDSEIFDQRLHKIAIYSQHLSITIDDFKNFFKKNKEKEETTFEAAIEDVLNITQISLENKNINVSTDFQYNKKVRIYANELKQVILNLIKNAEDVLLEKKVSNPKIIIRTFDKNGYTELSVEDNGGGIDDTIIGKIFDPYFSTKHDKDGTGLGLYMSKTIVEEHCAGTLSVKNGGDGAVFSIIMGNKAI